MSSPRSMFVAALAGACLFAIQSQARAGETAKITVTPTTSAGSVRLFVTDLADNRVVANVALAANTNAANKATAIKNALVAANGMAPFAYAANAGTVSVTNNGTLSIVVNLNPRNTGEAADRIVIPGSTPSTFPGGHGKMDPHAPTMSLFDGNSNPYTFTAGVTTGGTDYVVTLNGTQIETMLGGSATSVTGAQLATFLYDDLTTTYSSIPGVSLSLVTGYTNGYSGDLAISAAFASGTSDDGIVWGTTSIISEPNSDSNFGYLGVMAGSVPEPSSVVMLSMGALGACSFAWRRRHARAARPTA